MPRSRQAPAVSSQTVPLTSDLVRAVSANPALTEASLQCLNSLASEIRNNEISKTSLLQSGAINNILIELETGHKNKSRYVVVMCIEHMEVTLTIIVGLTLSTRSRECCS